MPKHSFVPFIALALVVGIGLTGCGRKGAPVAPGGKDPNYPRTYPAVSAPPPYVNPDKTPPATAPAQPPKSGDGGVYQYLPNWK